MYFFVGMPLAGKTTLAKRLSADLRVEYMSTGDYARSLGMELEPSIKMLDLSMRYNTAINLAVEALCKRKKQMGTSGIVDGFPRSIEQARWIEEERSRFGFVAGYKVIFVKANPLTIYDRIAVRRRSEGRPEDEASIVAGRINRSLALLEELRDIIGERLVEFDSERGFECLKRKLCID